MPRHLLNVFAKRILLEYLKQKKPKIFESRGTVRKFYLPLEVARRLAARVIEGDELA